MQCYALHQSGRPLPSTSAPSSQDPLPSNGISFTLKTSSQFLLLWGICFTSSLCLHVPHTSLFKDQCKLLLRGDDLMKEKKGFAFLKLGWGWFQSGMHPRYVYNDQFPFSFSMLVFLYHLKTYLRARAMVQQVEHLPCMWQTRGLIPRHLMRSHEYHQVPECRVRR